jgi:serine/threonine-protein kinase
MPDPHNPHEDPTRLFERGKEAFGGPAPDTGESTIVMSATELQKLTDARKIGEYQLLEELGRGGWGTVYKAFHTGLRRIVALKLLHQGSTAALRRFEREIQVQARLRHPNICPAYDCGTTPDGRQYLVMDYIEGKPLSRLLADGTASLPAIAAILGKVARALDHAHKQGILHRDIKPDNILVDKRGEPFVVDFGIAREVDRSSSEALTQAGQVVGTPTYIAPEQLREGKAGPSSDIWAIGVILYLAMAGRPPFAGRTDVETLQKILAEAPAALKTSPATADLWAICAHCLEKDPSARYAAADTLATDLQAFADGEAISLRKGPVGERLRRAIRDGEWGVVATVVGVAQFAVIALFALAAAWKLAAWISPPELQHARAAVMGAAFGAASVLVAVSTVLIRATMRKHKRPQR